MTRLAAFARSVVLLAVAVVGIPGLLIWAARERFGGGHPMYGVPRPADWSVDRVRGALADRLTDQTIADIVIRLSLVVAWVAIVVLLVTVVAEVVHMVRHDGLPLPDVRGMGLPQRLARVIAAGLLVVIPLVATSSAALARSGASLPSPGASGHGTAAASVVDAMPKPVRSASIDITDGGLRGVDIGTSQAPAVDGAITAQYVVKAGDSIYGIAARAVGPNPAAVATYAEQIIELNMGREMVDGRTFNNAAFIDVGWVLEVPAPPAPTVESAARTSATGHHVVARGETLWSIADDELGDPERWREIYDANQGRLFGSQTFDDPSLIQPGWQLEIPRDDGSIEASDVSAEVAEVIGGDELNVDDAPAEQSTEAPVEIIDASPSELAPTDGATPASDATPDSSVDASADTTPGTSGDAEHDGRPDNVWQHDAAATPGITSPADGAAQQTPQRSSQQSADTEGVELLTLGRAAMLSAGALTLLAARRRNLMRRAQTRAQLVSPASRPTQTERALRSVDAGDRFARVVAALRSIAPAVAAVHERVLLVISQRDGDLEVRLTGAVTLSAPWVGAAETWRLPASAPLELLTDHTASWSPCPALVQLGQDLNDGDVYVDLEATEAIEVGGPGAHADAVVAAVAATLAGSTLAEVATLVGVGVPDEAFLGHRMYRPAGDVAEALGAAAGAIGSTASMERSTFELRTLGAAGDAFEPAIVVAGASVGTLSPPANRTGLAVVSASPVHGPSSRLAPDGDAWRLLPADIRLIPVGLTADDVAALAELVTVDAAEFTTTADPPPGFSLGSLDDGAVRDHLPDVAIDRDLTLITNDGDGSTGRKPAPTSSGEAHVDDDEAPATRFEYSLLVRLFGPIEVVDRDGAAAAFERSKTRELIAWLATHRDRSTRSAARTAMWELDVRDATFSNVVSEARRSLARLVPPPEGEEWVARTMTDSLPIHEQVVTDADLVQHALDTARMQPPSQAIATLTPAVELIGGLPFAGTSYLWPDSEGLTSNYVLLATSATTELAAHCLSVGDVEGVFAATARGLAVLPGHEELIGLRMRAHATVGDLAGVRQEWESYERVINSDPWSDGEPAAKLVELRASLLSPTT